MRIKADGFEKKGKGFGPLSLTLSRKKSGQIQYHSTDEYLQIHPNAIQDTFLSLFDRGVKRALEIYKKRVKIKES